MSLKIFKKLTVLIRKNKHWGRLIKSKFETNIHVAYLYSVFFMFSCFYEYESLGWGLVMNRCDVIPLDLKQEKRETEERSAWKCNILVSSNSFSPSQENVNQAPTF